MLSLASKIEIKVKPTASLTYPVYIEQGLYPWQQGLLSEFNPKRCYFLITESGLPKSLIHSFLQVLKPFFPLGVKDPKVVFLRGGEACKSIKKLAFICEYLVHKGVDRNSCLLALGGGVIGDLTGFVAASLLRGIDFIQVPTTLLAAVDSSVGGKVAVNIKHGKNMVGAFHHPRFVYFNTEFLETLPVREWNCGLAELFKHGLIERSGTLLQNLYRYSHSGALRNPKSEELSQAILQSIQVKANIVWEDEKESGLRQSLNLGHTTAHALESLSRRSFFPHSLLTHGEAVGRGLVTALLLSRNLHGLSSDFIEEFLQKMQEIGLSQDTRGYSAKAVYKHIRYDKKAHLGEPQFVLLKAPGKVICKQSVSEKEFEKAWQEQYQRFG